MVDDHAAGVSIDLLNNTHDIHSMSDLLKRIAIDPTLSHGKPVIRGKRYPVESMLEYLSAGDTIEELLVEFPDLEKDDLLACIEFASRALKLKGARVPLVP